MAETGKTIQDHSQDKLLGVFTKSNLLTNLVYAAALHLVLFGLLGVPTIRGWIDPEYAAAQAEQEKSEQQQVDEAAEETTAQTEAEGEETADTGEGDTAETQAAASEAAAGEGDTAEGEGEGDEELSPVEQRVTETADPDEIPSDPDPLGISIDDTN